MLALGAREQGHAIAEHTAPKKSNSSLALGEKGREVCAHDRVQHGALRVARREVGARLGHARRESKRRVGARARDSRRFSIGIGGGGGGWRRTPRSIGEVVREQAEFEQIEPPKQVEAPATTASRVIERNANARQVLLFFHEKWAQA